VGSVVVGQLSRAQNLEIVGAMDEGFVDILTPGALDFVVDLEREFGSRRRELLTWREARQRELDAGRLPDFLAETANIRDGDWSIAPIPADLTDRRVEITGPAERKMVINALNSGARVFMADFEDASSPTWTNCVRGQMNVRDAVDGTISYTSPEGKRYAPGQDVATLMVRPRGWHLVEKHMIVDGRPVSAGLFDFGLCFFHNARKLLDRGTGPYFYLPKLENHLEARLWNDVFLFAQERLGVPRGSIKATVLIENILASFEMHEILYELREHSAGLNCGRWDYIFSAIRKFRHQPEFILPDRASVTMTAHFMRSYSLLCIQTCHRRGTHAMGGMAAQIPIKDDPVAGEAALEKVRADKSREVADGHDGTWVAHPGLVPLATETFDRGMPGDNQIDRKRADVDVTATDLLRFPEGDITEDGLRTNISVGLGYLEPWLRGLGCVPINQLMEDAATAEISRSQVWQWIHHRRGVIAGGSEITGEMVRSMVADEVQSAKRRPAAAGHRYDLAGCLFDEITTGKWVDFLTTAGYRYLDG